MCACVHIVFLLWKTSLLKPCSFPRKLSCDKGVFCLKGQTRKLLLRRILLFFVFGCGRLCFSGNFIDRRAFMVHCFDDSVCCHRYCLALLIIGQIVYRLVFSFFWPRDTIFLGLSYMCMGTSSSAFVQAVLPELIHVPCSKLQIFGLEL